MTGLHSTLVLFLDSHLNKGICCSKNIWKPMVAWKKNSGSNTKLKKACKDTGLIL